MHDAAFDAAGIDARYVLLRAGAGRGRGRGRGGARARTGSGSASRRRTSRSWPGCRRGRAPTRATIGAVNNVGARTPTAGSSASTPTRPGFRAGVELAMGRPLAGADVVVAGAGGAAHAVVYALPRRRCAPGHGRQPDRPLGRGAAASGSRRSATRRGSRVASTTPAFAAALEDGRPRGQRDDRRHGRRRARRSPSTRLPADGDGLRPRLRPGRDAAARARRGRAACGRPTARRC